MDSNCDVLVIGGGMAGLVAGITAAEMNLDTLVVRKGEGATSMSSGAIDVAGYLRGASTPFLSPLEGIAAYSQVYPFHPYSLLSSMERDDAGTWIKETFAWLTHILDGTSAATIGNLDRTHMALTVLGTKKPTCFVQTTMYTERLENNEEVLLFAGIKGLPDFNSSAAAKSLMDQVISTGMGPRKIIHSNLECSPFQKTFNISPIELARHIETEAGLIQIIEELRKQINQTDASLVALPPILGLRSPLQIKKRIEQETGVEVFELLSFPPSVPGHRLQRSLESVLKKKGGNLLLGHEAYDFEQEGNRIVNVTLQSPRRNHRVFPKTVILASGKYAAGGIVGDAAGLHESIFDIPILDGAHIPVNSTRPRNLTRNISIQSNGHRLFECGVGVDDRLQPLSASGDCYLSNLYCAGSILSGYNYPIEKSGLGVALTTGRASGHLASDAVKGGD